MDIHDKRVNNPIFDNSIRGDSDNEVRTLFQSAKKRREDRIKYRLLAKALEGEAIDVTQSNQLFEALNREKMEFEHLLRLHPEEAQYHIEYIKQRKVETDGKWWNPHSKAKWGEKGVIPPCCYYARPRDYWKNPRLVNNFFNTFPKFRVSDKAL